MTMTMNITREIVFFKNHAEKEAKKLVLGLFLFFKKPLYGVKITALQLSLYIFRKHLSWHAIKTNRIKL